MIPKSRRQKRKNLINAFKLKAKQTDIQIQNV